MKHKHEGMLKAGSGGSIVNTASVGGTVAIPAHVEYIAAKHAVIGLTRTAAFDYGQQGIRVNAVLPDRKSTRLNSSHYCASRMPSSARKKKRLMRTDKFVSGHVSPNYNNYK